MRYPLYFTQYTTYRVHSPMEDIRSIQHYGLKNIPSKLVGSLITTESDITPSFDPFTSWTTYTHATPYELMCKLSLHLDNHIIEVLEDVGYSPEFLDKLEVGKCVTARKLLSNHPNDYREGQVSVLLDSQPIGVLVTPKLLLLSLILFNGFECDRSSPEFRLFLTALEYNSKLPGLCRVGIELYRTCSELQYYTPNPELLGKSRLKENDKRKHRIDFSKSKLIYPDKLTIEDKQEFDSMGMSYDTAFSYGSIDIILIPSHNRGKHVCTVRILNKTNGSKFDLGTIRKRSDKDDRLFFSCPSIVASKGYNRELDKRLVSGYKTQCKVRDQIEDLKVKLTTVNNDIARLKATNPNLKARGIKGLIEESKRLSKEISDLKTKELIATNLIRSHIGQIDQTILEPLYTGLNDLGLWCMNNYIKSIPESSPLISPRYLLFVRV